MACKQITYRLGLMIIPTIFLFSCSFQKKTTALRPPSIEADAATTVKIVDIRQEIVQEAREAVGSGYLYGATGKKGYDCSGLVWATYSSKKIDLPRSTRALVTYGNKISKNEIQPGDLVFFKNTRKIDHVAIVSRITPSKTWLIHSTTSSGVVEEPLESSYYWASRVAQYRRILNN